MSRIPVRAAIAGLVLLPLSQAGGGAALADTSGAAAKYDAIAREADAVLLLDRQAGIIYRCPTNYVSRCHKLSHVE